MGAGPYDPSAYRQFAENLAFALRGENIQSLGMRRLKRKAWKSAFPTAQGSPLWWSAVSSRMAAKTVYLGSSPDTVLPNPTPQQLAIVERAPEQLHKVLQLLHTMPFVHVRRQMGDNPEFNPICNLYVCVADPKHYRIAYEWASTMGEVKKHRPGPEFFMIDIPMEHQLRMQILVLPEYDINVALGTDYTGECKKGFLRQAMFRADQLGMLGLHAGTKIVRVKDAASGKLKTFAVFMFGLTATGKSTWSCHQLGLDPALGEGTWVAQDDIVFLRRDGSSYGTEQNYYVKTDVDPQFQEAMYSALTHRSALLENVMVNAKGELNFLDERLGENGRAVIARQRLAIKRNNRWISTFYESINTPPIEELDGIVFAFITRRNTIMPFAQRLTPEQGVLAYLWGESTHSFATVPERAGESVRIVGMDDFIIGLQGRKVNTFYDMVMELVHRYPGKVHFFQYNTGGMGEIIQTDPQTGKKVLVRKAQRVPIDLMAALQRAHLRGTAEHAPGRLGTEYVVRCEGLELSAWDPSRFYSQEQIEEYVAELVAGRRVFTDEIAAQGLRKDIVKLAHQELDRISGIEKPERWAEPEPFTSQAAEDRIPGYVLPWPRR
ncbi:MAG: phosphoenolpyruvate carboxykinase (ATP) [Thermoanaerobaculaceae bacterium]